MNASTQIFWHIARSSGIVSWALLAASVVWGLAISTRITGGRPKANWLLDLHRYLGGLAVVFCGVHVGALVFDSYVDFGPSEILVPLASSYRPAAVAWGVVSMYLLAAVQVTSLLRKRLSRKVWHLTHLASLPLFALATAHGIFAGTDGTNPVLFVSMVATSVLVLGLSVARVDQARSKKATRAQHQHLRTTIPSHL